MKKLTQSSLAEQERITALEQEVEQLRTSLKLLTQAEEERKLAEQKLKNRLEVEKLLTNISISFLNLDPGEFGQRVTQALQWIGEFVGVEHSYLTLFSEDGIEQKYSYKWSISGSFPDIQLEQPAAVRQAEIEKFEQNNPGSQLTIPIIHNRKLSGFIGLSTIRQWKSWSESTIMLLQLGGEFLISVLQRQQIYAELSKTQELYRAVIRNFPNGSIFVFDQDLRYIVADGEELTSSRFCSKELEGKTLQDVLPDNQLESYYRAALAGTTATFETFYNNKTSLIRALPLKNEQGEVIAGMLVSQDITEQKRAEEELRLSQEQFAKIFQVTPMSIAITRVRDGRYFDVNDAFLNLTGYTREEIIGHSALEKIWIDPQERLNFIQALTQQGWVRAMEVQMGSKHGKIDPGLLSAEIIELTGEKYVLSNFLPITERKHAEEALATEKERLAVTLHSIGDAVITTDTAGKVILLNPVAEELTGWKQAEAEGQPLNRILQVVKGKTGQFVENVVARVVESRTLFELPRNIRLMDRENSRARQIVGSAAPISNPASGHDLIGVVLVFRDVTEKVQMEQELFKAQKLESLGLLAGGIAHDFNNILTAAVGYISLARHEVTEVEQPSLYELLNEAETSIFRAHSLTQQLLTFSKGGTPIRKTSELPPLVQEEVRFALRGSNVKAQVDLPADLWPVDIDEGQITQVIHNLVINAVQAMPHGGTIRIEAENISTHPKRPLDLPLPLKDKVDYIRLAVKDEGVGIKSEILLKIFDPYFTTKPKGNGLGLASCFSILHQHDGFITAQSKEGEGTTFFLYLPATNKEALPVSHLSQTPSVKNKRTEQGERLLVVDDEQPILSLLKRVLEYSGYVVDNMHNSGRGAKMAQVIKPPTLKLRRNAHDFALSEPN